MPYLNAMGINRRGGRAARLCPVPPTSNSPAEARRGASVSKEVREREQLQFARSRLGWLYKRPFQAFLIAYDHTTLNTRHPVRSAKLSSVGPG
jgi:hypothetical protein